MSKCAHRWQRVPHLGKNKFKCDWCELFGFCNEDTKGRVVPHSKDVSEDLMDQYNILTLRRMGKLPPARVNPYALPVPYVIPGGHVNEEQD